LRKGFTAFQFVEAYFARRNDRREKIEIPGDFIPYKRNDIGRQNGGKAVRNKTDYPRRKSRGGIGSAMTPV